MVQQISRRIFLALAGSALVAGARLSASEETLPASLDHIILGTNDLERGIAFMEKHTGVRAAFGGVHPGRGTRNALLSLGALRYLEIMAPDPGHDVSLTGPAANFVKQQRAKLLTLSEPRLLAWGVHTNDISGLADSMRAAGFGFYGPTEGSRARPDGKTLHWKIVGLQDDRAGLLPFFIEWDRDSVHPSQDAPHGCNLTKFVVLAPNPDELSQTARRLGIEVTVERAEKAQLWAQIAGPRGEIELTS